MNSRASSNAQQNPSLSRENDNEEADVSNGAAMFAKALAGLSGESNGEDDDEGDETGDGFELPDDETGAPRESGKKVKLDTFENLAASLGIDVAKLYEVKIPGSGGREAMTVGQIKDRFHKWGSLETDQLALTEERVRQEAEFEATRAELRELLAVVPKENLSQDALRAAAARVAARNKADAARVLVVMPEWRDEERRTAEVNDISAMLAGYGLPASFVQTIRNPALLKALRDSARREKQVQAALAAMKKVPRKKVAAQANQGRTAPRIQSQQEQRQNGGKPSLKPTTGRERFSQKLAQLS